MPHQSPIKAHKHTSHQRRRIAVSSSRCVGKRTRDVSSANLSVMRHQITRQVCFPTIPCRDAQRSLSLGEATRWAPTTLEKSSRVQLYSVKSLRPSCLVEFHRIPL